MIRSLSKFLTRIILTPLFRISISGRENIPGEGPVLLCANHVTMLDMFFIGYKIKRWIYWMAKEELFRIPVVSFVIRKLWGAFPIKRGKADVESIKTALEHLKNGHIVGIFPQGTRSGKSVRPGAAVIAIKADVPLLPVLIVGGKKIFGKVRVRFGKPFMLKDEASTEPDKNEIRRLSERIMEKINELAEEMP